MKIAIVCDWLVGMRGGEMVLNDLCDIFPQAEIFTLVYNKGSLTPKIENKKIHTSFLQGFPFVKSKYRHYLPLFPKAVESFNLGGFDLVISLSHCVAKGAIPPKGARHICYCYTPMRYVWLFFDEYFGHYNYFQKGFIKAVAAYLKKWDIATLNRVDKFIAISNAVRERISNIYKRDSDVIYPPVDVDYFGLANALEKDDFYLTVSALVPYKRVDLLVKAFNQIPDKRLFIVGDGGLRKTLQNMAKSSNILFLGRVGRNRLRQLYQKAKAFIYAAEEDFGIAPLEAQSCGTPVITFSRGGTKETTVDLNNKINQPPTGVTFKLQSESSIVEAVSKFEENEKEFNSQKIRVNALRFSHREFKRKIKEYITGYLGNE